LMKLIRDVFSDLSEEKDAPKHIGSSSESASTPTSSELDSAGHPIDSHIFWERVTQGSDRESAMSQ
jgi:hypothetical protein